MDDRKPSHLEAVPPSLKAALRRARVESAEQGEVVADLRQAEIARLELLIEAVRPVLDQAPDGVDLFDVGIVHGERPRLFLDVISFVDLGHDRKTYRFFQDTRHGRVLIAESPNIDRIVSAMTNYIARRLVEREQALASDWRSRSDAGATLKAGARAKQMSGAAKVVSVPEEPGSARRRSVGAVAADVLGFVVMTIGSFTLVGAVCVGLWVLWNAWGRDVWAANFGPPPF
jgi:hypothetical protein